MSNLPKVEIDKYTGNFTMHCDTEEKARIFIKFLNSHGRKWCTGEPYDPNGDLYWEYNENNTCYFFNEGVFGGIYFPEETNGYVILEFDDFDWAIGGTKMKNKDVYKEELIKSCKVPCFSLFFDKYIVPAYNCWHYEDLTEETRIILTMLWLDEEYKEPEMD